jgi:hypothetical protein
MKKRSSHIVTNSTKINDDDQIKNYDVLSNQKHMTGEDYSLVQQETNGLTDTIDHDKYKDFDRIMDSTYQ